MVPTANGNQGATFSITDTKLYIPVVTLSTENNAKLLQKLKSGFRRTIKWNKYRSKVSIEKPNQYLDYLIDPMLKGEKRLFVLSFENNDHRTSFKLYFFQLLK